MGYLSICTMQLRQVKQQQTLGNLITKYKLNGLAYAAD